MRSDRSRPSSDPCSCSSTYGQSSCGFWYSDVWLAQVNRLERWQRKAALCALRKSRQDERRRIAGHCIWKLRQRFGKIDRQLRAAVPGDFKAHVLQSAGTLAFNNPLFDMVRAGIMLYGISPLPEFQKLLKPAMTWKTRIALVRDMPKGSSISYGRTFIAPRKMRIATLSAGYADGYPWHLSNRDAAVLVRGRRCALVGRVTMDLMMIDVSKIDNVQVGNEVVLMGRDGNEEISCAELAARAGTIAWEIITRIGSRVRRVFV